MEVKGTCTTEQYGKVRVEFTGEDNREVSQVVLSREKAVALKDALRRVIVDMPELPEKRMFLDNSDDAVSMVVGFTPNHSGGPPKSVRLGTIDTDYPREDKIIDLTPEELDALMVHLAELRPFLA